MPRFFKLPQNRAKPRNKQTCSKGHFINNLANEAEPWGLGRIGDVKKPLPAMPCPDPIMGTH